MIVVAILGGCKGEISDERRALLDEVEGVLSNWDRAHRAIPLEDGAAACSDLELEALRDVLICHQDLDVDFWCAATSQPDGCYAPVSDACWTRVDERYGPVSDACLTTYEASFVPGELGVLAPEDCAQASAALGLATAVYTASDSELAADVRAELPSFVLDATFSGGLVGGRALLGRTDDGACHVAFKGTDSAEDVLVDLASISQTRCTASNGALLGACGDGFFAQYEGLRADGVFDAALAAVDAGDCPAGLHVTGHSLGGAEASIFAADVTISRPDVALTVHTFGEPRAFDAAAADGFEVVSKVRWRTWGDPVTAVPLSSWGFRHFGEARELYRSWTGAAYVTEEPVDSSPYGADVVQHETATYREALDASCRW